MDQWRDQGVILNIRPHGENGAVVSVLCENYGRYAGYVRGIHSNKNRGVIQKGNQVEVEWSARASENLGSFSLEAIKPYASDLMYDGSKLAAMQSACALSDASLPEREVHTGFYHGLVALFDIMEQDIWRQAYILWEIGLLKELGFALNLKECAGGGDPQTLAYVSPKTGRAVSYEKGEAYKDKLLPLPDFLKPQGGAMDHEEVLKGLRMTGYFLEHWVFADHTKGMPEARYQLENRLKSTLNA